MARTRNIKPSFFTNEELAELPPETRLLFIGLWTLADREGRMEYRPKRIKAALFPYESYDVEKMIGELSQSGFIVIYVADGAKYLVVKGFKKHQRPHHQEPESSIPNDFGSASEVVPNDFGCNTESIALVALTLNPQPLTLNPLSPPAAGTAKTSSPNEPKLFAEFWEAYPLRHGKRVGKGAALKVWKSLKAEDQALTVTAAKNYATSKAAKENFVKDPERFLKSDYWRDWLTPAEIVPRRSRVPTEEECARWNPIDGGLAGDE